MSCLSRAVSNACNCKIMSDLKTNVEICPFCQPTINDDVLSTLQDALPPPYHYLVDSYSSTESGVNTLIHVNIKEEQQVSGWLSMYQEMSKLTYRVAKTFPDNQTKVLFKKKYRCQHNTRVASAKNTECPAEMLLTLRRTEFNRTHSACASRLSRSKDRHIPEFPCTIELRAEHNHSIQSAAALRYRDVSATVRHKFEQLFSSGYSPSAAYQLHQYDLQMEQDSLYYAVSGDRRHCPDKGWCYRLYYHLFHTAYGSSDTDVNSLRSYIEALNGEMRSAAVGCNDTENFVALSSTDDPLIVAICTPLMKRVHRMVKHSAELVFVDASGTMDRQNTRVFLLLTHSAAGGLPLGVLMVSDEQCTTISAALQLYMTLLDNDCFAGRSGAGPVVFMTDDSTAERNALRATFPDSTLLLCAFHVLQAWWRFLWDHKSNVKKELRQRHTSQL